MIDPEMAWPLIRVNALKALKVNMVWHSLVEGNAYQLESVNEDRLVIIRIDAEHKEVLRKSRVLRAANDFKNANCVVKRRHLISPTVAEETAFVLFHPFLTWDDNGEFIIEVG